MNFSKKVFRNSFLSGLYDTDVMLLIVIYLIIYVIVVQYTCCIFESPINAFPKEAKNALHDKTNHNFMAAEMLAILQKGIAFYF